MSVLAIDPGSQVSGYVEFSDGKIIRHGITCNEGLLKMIEIFDARNCAIEFTPPYAMASRKMPGKPVHHYVPSQVFEAAFFAGRVAQEWMSHRGELPKLMKRGDVLKFITGKRTRVNDKDVRAALIERFGGEEAIGRKAPIGKRITSHCWAALAVAVTYEELEEKIF